MYLFMASCFTQWVTMQWYHSLFWCSNYAIFCQWKPSLLGIYTLLSYPHHGLTVLYLLLQWDVLASQPWNKLFLQVALIPFSRERYLDTNIWVLNRLIPSVVLPLMFSSRTELDLTCIWLPKSTLIPIQCSRIHLNFLPLFVTPLSYYHKYVCLIVFLLVFKLFLK